MSRGKQRYTERIYVRLTPDTNTELTKQAVKKKKKPNILAREIIEQGLTTEGKPTNETSN